MVNDTPLDRIFGALADPTRRRIVERLARRPLTVGQIARDFPISQPAISKHVRILEESGLLQREIVGREHICHLSPDAMANALRWVEQQRRYWVASLDRLDTLLNEPQKPKRST